MNLLLAHCLRVARLLNQLKSQHSMCDEGLVHKTAQSTFKHVPAKLKPIESKQFIIALIQ